MDRFLEGANGVPDGMPPSQPRRGLAFHLRRAAIVGGSLFLVFVLILVLLPFVNLGPLAARIASRLLDRPAAVDELHVVVGRSIGVELRGVRLSNPPGSSQPEMAALRALAATIALPPLLTGRLQFTSVTIDSPTILLGRDANGRGNWRFWPGAGPASPGTIAPAVRAALPIITALSLRGGDLVFRTTSGAMLHIELHDVVIRTPAPDRPIVLAAEGAYNGAPIRLVVSGQPMVMLHDRAIPYGVTSIARSGSTAVNFRGTMNEPLNFDGIQGRVQLDAADMAEALAAAGIAVGISVPFAAVATLDKQGDAWKLTDIAGTLMHNAFQGNGELLEGGRGQPDRVAFDAGFDTLDLGALAAGMKPGAKFSDDLPAKADRPGTLVDARISAATARFGEATLSDVSLRAHAEPGRVTLDDASLFVAGGKVRLWASAEPATNGPHMLGRATIARADASELVRWLGGPPRVVAGRVDGGVTLDLVGDTVPRALAAGRITAVVAMRDGSVTHNMFELASIDLRRLLRKRAGSARLSCLIGIAHLKNGSGPMNPLRVRTSDGTIGGSGWIDLTKRVIDMTIQSESASTGFFALDVPVRIAGSFRNPNITPALRASSQTPFIRIDQANLPADLQEFIRGNPCLR